MFVDNDFPHEIEVDDVATQNNYEPTASNIIETTEYSDESQAEMDEDDLENMSISSSQSENSDEEIADGSLRSASGVVWARMTENNPQGRLPSHNVCNIPGAKKIRRGLHPNSPKDSFLIFFNTIIQLITQYSNQHARRMCRVMNVMWKTVDESEMEAYIGLNIIAGLS